MSQISVNSLTFCYEGSYDNIFENVSFAIDTDWKLGFVGRNGRGKTTFLKLLMGENDYRGSIASSVEFDYFPFEVAEPDALAMDCIASVCPDAEKWEILREINRLNVDAGALYRPFNTLSHGERTKLMLAGMFLRRNSFLLIDEPTNHLDAEGRAQVAEYLNGKKGFILVSHDRAFLDGCVDHILSINRADITVTKGNFSQWWENKRRQDTYEQGENERLMGDIRRLSEAARRTAAWADRVEGEKIGDIPNRDKYIKGGRAYIGEQSRKMQQRRKNIERRQQNAIEEKKTLLKNIERSEELKIHTLGTQAQRIIEARELSLSYGERRIFENLSFELRAGDIIALAGRNGCGKSSIIKAAARLAGCDMHGAAYVPYTGLLKLPSGVTASYVPQDTSFLRGMAADYARRMGADISLFLTILRKMDFPRVQFEKDMQSYSAGQRKKVLLAASLCQSAHVFIWDEPLNYIDLLSRIQLEELIKKNRPTMLIVEHDRAFIENIGAEVVGMG